METSSVLQVFDHKPKASQTDKKEKKALNIIIMLFKHYEKHRTISCLMRVEDGCPETQSAAL